MRTKHRNTYRDRITRRLRYGRSPAQIADALGLDLDEVWRVIRTKQPQNKGDFRIDPAELARRCATIRDEWSPEERAKRAGWAVNPSPEIPVIPVPRGVAEPCDDAA